MEAAFWEFPCWLIPRHNIFLLPGFFYEFYSWWWSAFADHSEVDTCLEDFSIPVAMATVIVKWSINPDLSIYENQRAMHSSREHKEHKCSGLWLWGHRDTIPLTASLSDSEMRLQAVTFTTPPRKLKAKLWRASVSSPSRDQRQSPGTETVQRILQEAPTGFLPAQELGISACRSYHFHPQAIDLT